MGPPSLTDTHTPPVSARQVPRALAVSSSFNSVSTTAGKTPPPAPLSRGINNPNGQGNTRSPSLVSGRHLNRSDHQNDTPKLISTRTHDDGPLARVTTITMAGTTTPPPTGVVNPNFIQAATSPTTLKNSDHSSSRSTSFQRSRTAER
jgi:hypothetical protein